MTKSNAPRLVGVDIGGTKLYAIVVDRHGKILGSARKKSKPEAGFDGVMSRVVSLVEQACDDADTKLEQVVAIGVGAPSPMLPDGTAVNAPNMGWRNAPLGKTLAAALGRPIYAANDCNAGTLGEYTFGAGRGARSLVGLFMGTGLGGGIVLDGKVIAGENYRAAEVGHIPVVANGRRCGCGHRGCLEAYASKTGMGQRITWAVTCDGQKTALTRLCKGEYGNIRSSVLAKAYAMGDELAVDTLDEAAQYLGYGVGAMITLLGPNVVVLGGGVIEALGKTLLPQIKQAARSVTHPPSSFRDTKIRLAKLGDDAVALGAVAWARQQLPV